MHRGDCSFCTKLLRKDLFTIEQFPVGALNEDFHLLVKMLTREESAVPGIACIPGQAYHVFYRPDSNTRDKNRFSRVFADNIDNADMVLALVDKKYPELCLIPSAQTRDKDSVSPEQMKELINQMREQFEYILLDCPAGIEQGFKNAIAGADRAIIVTTPEVSAIRDADRIIGLLEAEELKKIELVINRIRMDMVKRGDMMSVEDVVDILAIDLIGVVPDDESIVIATNEGEPLVGSDTQAGKAFANICHRVLGEEVPIMEFETESILKKIANLFKCGY